MDRHPDNDTPHPHCCPCCDHSDESPSGVSRRTFLGGAAALGGIALTGLTWSRLSAAEPEVLQPGTRRALVVKPVFVYGTYKPVHQKSWRPWGGIQTPEDAEAEVKRIQGELKQLEAQADFPVEFLPVSAIKSSAEIDSLCRRGQGRRAAGLCGGGRSETPSRNSARTASSSSVTSRAPSTSITRSSAPGSFASRTDELVVKGIDDEDVVVDKQEEITWRLRALCGLRNTMGTKILAVGGPGGWAQPAGVIPELARKTLETRHPNRHLRRTRQAARSGSGRFERPSP